MDENTAMEPRMAVVGVGGAGCNVAGRFYDDLLAFDVIAINTDAEALSAASADSRVPICGPASDGGTRGDRALGMECARAHEGDIAAALRGHDVAFIVAGLGGGTGAGAASVIAEICAKLDIMTFTFAINPFSFESRSAIASEGLEAVRRACPDTFVIENERILAEMPDASLGQAADAVNASIEELISGLAAAIPQAAAE
ncbi:MAG: cell division protein FtsZ [Candidatus Methanoplasma sp.]|jgi:cell division protein FtsZ|nr:cell division protein FtsZ [Candidatus Methanoplasma sp.]